MTPTQAFPIEVRGSATQPLGMSPARFLRDYWQKRPLLIRGAFPDFEPPLQPDDLAGLACEPAALARLTCPIGIPGITGKEPDVIAVAVAAQLLQQSCMPAPGA